MVAAISNAASTADTAGGALPVPALARDIRACLVFMPASPRPWIPLHRRSCVTPQLPRNRSRALASLSAFPIIPLQSHSRRVGPPPATIEISRPEDVVRKLLATADDRSDAARIHTFLEF